jgi:hypothetical protein
MGTHKPYVKHLRISGGKTATEIGQSFGHAFDAAMKFLRDRRIVAWELVAERTVFVRGRGKRLTRVSKAVRDRLIVTMPKRGFGRGDKLPPGFIRSTQLPHVVYDRRKGGRRR